VDEIGIGEVACGKWEHNGRVNRVIYSNKAMLLLIMREWPHRLIEVAEQLTFEEILFLMEWRLVLVVKVLGKLIDKHREVDQAIRNKNARKEYETKDC